jgi:hypothetical protein
MRTVSQASFLVECFLLLLEEVLDGLSLSFLLGAGERNLLVNVAGGTQGEKRAGDLICKRPFCRLASFHSSPVFFIPKHGFTILSHASRCAF